MVVLSHGWLHRSRKLKKRSKRYGRSSEDRPPESKVASPTGPLGTRKDEHWPGQTPGGDKVYPCDENYRKAKTKKCSADPCSATRSPGCDDAENERGTESRSVQTDYQFFSLAELSDSPWEESEAESRFADDVTYLDTEDSSADGYWSDKAWSV